jgi:hypothetical protein
MQAHRARAQVSVASCAEGSAPARPVPALAPFCEGKTSEMLVFEHEAKLGEPRSAAHRVSPVCERLQTRRSSPPASARPAAHVRHAGDPHLQGPRGPAPHGPPAHHYDRIYLHYAPDEDAAAKLSSVWEDGDGRTPTPTPRTPASVEMIGAETSNVIPLRRAA